ncbi:MAG TPA: enoyl-CoA hydratase-related protein [Streptosporangiaceae bacterium]|nr:enoyl-CoA hydratase-related protein [Streptosporangiaceae bacterium]
MPDTVRWDFTEAVGTIVLNRPQAHNALTADMKTALLAALRQAAASPEVRAVLITGAGPAFCAGQDLREHAGLLAAAQAAGTAGRPAGTVMDTVRQHYNPIVLAIRSMPKPVIAAVNGVAAGAGASLALACDLRIAARSASFLMAFARVGLAADSGASWTLQRLVGAGRAAELLLLAEPLPAGRALELGLVSQVVDDAELPAAASALGARLALGPTAAYAGIKEELDYAAGHDLSAALEKEAEVQVALGRTVDHQAATAAFADKQRPTFQGR